MKLQDVLFSVTLLASPALFAQQADVTCESNMQELTNHPDFDRGDLGEAARGQIESHVRLAREAQASGDTEACIVHSSKALQEMRGVGDVTDDNEMRE